MDKLVCVDEFDRGAVWTSVTGKPASILHRVLPGLFIIGGLLAFVILLLIPNNTYGKETHNKYVWAFGVWTGSSLVGCVLLQTMPYLCPEAGLLTYDRVMRGHNAETEAQTDGFVVDLIPQTPRGAACLFLILGDVLFQPMLLLSQSESLHADQLGSLASVLLADPFALPTTCDWEFSLFFWMFVVTAFVLCVVGYCCLVPVLLDPYSPTISSRVIALVKALYCFMLFALVPLAHKLLTIFPCATQTFVLNNSTTIVEDRMLLCSDEMCFSSFHKVYMWFSAFFLVCFGLAWITAIHQLGKIDFSEARHVGVRSSPRCDPLALWSFIGSRGAVLIVCGLHANIVFIIFVALVCYTCVFVFLLWPGSVDIARFSSVRTLNFFAKISASINFNTAVMVGVFHFVNVESNKTNDDTLLTVLWVLMFVGVVAYAVGRHVCRNGLRLWDRGEIDFDFQAMEF